MNQRAELVSLTHKFERLTGHKVPNLIQGLQTMRCNVSFSQSNEDNSGHLPEHAHYEVQKMGESKHMNMETVSSFSSPPRTCQ